MCGGGKNCPMRILQLTSMRQPEVTARLIRATRHAPATVVLDLEDSLWDVIDGTGTAALKAAGRANLVTLAQTHPELFAQGPIGVRINRLSGPDAAPDFAALGRASRLVEFECVVPTKVESGAEIHEIRARLRDGGVAYRGIVPIVETRRGLANLDEITDAARSAGIEWLVYGHFDFALDSGWWPFPEPCQPSYWETVDPLIRRWERAGLGYVQPPYFQTHDRAGMAGILARLTRTCTREFGILTVTPRQTEMVSRLNDAAGRTEEALEPAPARTTLEPCDPTETPADLARHVIDTFLATRRESAGFALEPRSGEFISPHMYLAARDYLARVAHD